METNKSIIETSAFAREEEGKKGMDGSQVTGASSSYARKYALNGMFAIDDNKDSDTTNISEENNNLTNKILNTFNGSKLLNNNVTEKEIADYLYEKNYMNVNAKSIYNYMLRINWSKNWKQVADFFENKNKKEI